MVPKTTNLLQFAQFNRSILKTHSKLNGGTNGEESNYARRWWTGSRAAHRGSGSSSPPIDKKFDVWALSCIGAWVGIVYNQFEDDEVDDKDRAEQTYQFFKNGVFRDDESYERFPINTVFGPDWRSNIKALNNFVTDPDNYKDFLWDPYRMMDVFQESMELLFNQLPDK